MPVWLLVEVLLIRLRLEKRVFGHFPPSSFARAVSSSSIELSKSTSFSPPPPPLCQKGRFHQEVQSGAKTYYYHYELGESPPGKTSADQATGGRSSASSTQDGGSVFC